jgi:hypothetical protein
LGASDGSEFGEVDGYAPGQSIPLASMPASRKRLKKDEAAN